MLISSCVNGIRVVSGLISAGSVCCECPLIFAQRLKLQQPPVTGCVISTSTWRPWNMFSLFREHQKEFEFITEPLPQMAELLMEEHSRWWSLYKEYKEELLFSLYFFKNIIFIWNHFNSTQKVQVGTEGVIHINFGPSEVEAFESYCARWSETDMWV